MDTQELNNQLRLLYAKHWSELSGCIPRRRRYSYPFLLHASPDYTHARVKLFIVGQQASDWGGTEYGEWGNRDFPSPVETIMELYDTFNRGENYKPTNPTPFFKVAYKLQALLNPNSDRYGFMWSNLVRVDYKGNPKDGDRPPPDVEEAVCALPLLAEEIRICEPDAVVFMTGPFYDPRLIRTFPNVVFVSMPNFDSRQLAMLDHEALPGRTFRTYHPGHLMQSNNVDVDQVIGAIARGVFT